MKRVSFAVCSYSSMLDFLSKIWIQQNGIAPTNPSQINIFIRKKINVFKSSTVTISGSYQLKCNEIDVTFPSIGLKDLVYRENSKQY